MELLDISLIIIGIAIIFISYKLVDKTPKDIENSSTILDINNKVFEETIKNNLENYINEEIESTKKQLNTISNEKIMAISEYSDQVMKKISESNNEVVFLYKMLIEKEEKLKNKANINVLEKETKKSVKSVEKKEIKNDSDNSINSKPYNMVNDLHKEGKSIMEISKILNIGQGEVKLIIDLEKSRR